MLNIITGGEVYVNLEFFSATENQMDKLQASLHEASYIYSNLYAQFETTMEFVRAALPPCFDMPTRPIVNVFVGKWLSNHPNCPEFDVASILLDCKYKEYEGRYQLQMYLENDMAVFIGREAWGEPKKCGITQLYHYGDDLYGFCERHGRRIIEIEAHMDKNIGEEKMVSNSFEVKIQPDAQGHGFEHHPQMLVFEAKSHNRVHKEGNGTIRFHRGKGDRLDSIPISRFINTYYVEGRKNSRVVRVDNLSEGDTRYMATYYGQKYDLSDDYYISPLFKEDL